MSAQRRPHRFRIEADDPECLEAYQAALVMGVPPNDDSVECCWPMCWSVVEVVCPYGEGEDKVDCQLWEQCDHVHPADDPRFEDAAPSRLVMHQEFPLHDPRRWEQVYDADATVEQILLAKELEIQEAKFEDTHASGSWERVPGACWVQRGDHDHGQMVDDLNPFEPGWVEAYIENDGDMEESYLILDRVS